MPDPIKVNESESKIDYYETPQTPAGEGQGFSAADNRDKFLQGSIGAENPPVLFGGKKNADGTISNAARLLPQDAARIEKVRQELSAEQKQIDPSEDTNTRKSEMNDTSTVLVGGRRNPDGSLDLSKAVRLLSSDELSEKKNNQSNQETVQTRSDKRGDLDDLDSDLKRTYPDMNENQRFESWITSQEQQGHLKVFSNDISGSKTALVSEDNPNIIVKRFDKGAEFLGFEDEKEWDAIVSPRLGNRFLPKTEFIEITESVDRKKKYYILQDKVEGIQLKKLNEEAGERTASLTEEELDETYVQHPENWAKFKGEILQEKLTEQQWEKAQKEAKELYAQMNHSNKLIK